MPVQAALASSVIHKALVYFRDLLSSCRFGRKYSHGGNHNALVQNYKRL